MEPRHVIVPAHRGGPLDLSRPHFTGIAGAGMSPLARLLLESGRRVSGTDRNHSAALRELETVGAQVSVGHDAERLPADASVLVWSSAVTDSNPELQAARLRGVPVVHRSDVLAQLITTTDRSVAVTGTHGKTTTAILTVALAGQNPSHLIGGTPVGGPAARLDTGNLLIAEADESDRTVVATPSDTIRLIKRIRPGIPAYWVTVSGKIDPTRAVAFFAQLGLRSGGLDGRHARLPLLPAGQSGSASKIG
ncbi:Mur ligase domain-containing protein (plasmid) [Kitasatospora sp. NBC_00070]|uniref:Mur ligase domain-containing protein n=1 Tax=Kitasatospora sp. NBC_00070 TaxID=2975962 RepID=UPI002F916D37